MPLPPPPLFCMRSFLKFPKMKVIASIKSLAVFALASSASASSDVTAPLAVSLLPQKSNFESVRMVLDDSSFSATDKWGLYKSHFSKEFASFEAETAAFSAFEKNEGIINAHNVSLLTCATARLVSVALLFGYTALSQKTQQLTRRKAL